MTHFRGLTLNLLRIISGLMFWQHGAGKLFGWLGGTAAESWFSWPFGVAGVIEFFGGSLILLGLFTRPVAFVLSGTMAVTYFLRHFPQGFWPIENGGERAVLFCFIFLYLFAKGAGSLSVDAALARRKEKG